jgi:4-hydroxy-tetrahydrodipicolinate synthase
MTFDELRTKLAGIVAITVTPFTENGEIDDLSYARLLRRMADAGIETVTPNGNVSEFYSLTDEEARHAVELSVAAVGSQCIVLAGVGHSVSSAIDAAHHARAAGAQAIMIHQPVNPFISRDGWLNTIGKLLPRYQNSGWCCMCETLRLTGRPLRNLLMPLQT